jgi:hypothetical protein
MCLNVYNHSTRDGVMKSFSFLSMLLLAGAVSAQAQALEQPKKGSPGVAVFTWNEMAPGPWQAQSPARLPIAPALPADGMAMPHIDAAPDPVATLAASRDFGVNTFLTTLNLPQAGYAMPAQTSTAGAIKAKTELSGKFELGKSIAEPASEVLMLVALASLAIAVRRRMPNERF